MSFGMGLAGFVDGMNAGMAARDRFDARRERRANKQAMEQIDTDTKTAYSEAKASGEETGSFEDFWVKYALPKRKVELMRQGDYDTAAKLQEWSDTEGAKTGSKLFSSALLKAQNGDASGALDDAIKAAQTKGYLDSGYELKSRDEIKDPDGNLLGYRLTVTDGDGNEFQQDVAPQDVPRVVSTFVNPEAAFAAKLEAEAAAAARKNKQDDEVETHRAKKEIDQQYETNSADKDAAELEQYRTKKQIDKEMSAETPDQQAQKAFRARLENDMSFQTKSPEEQRAIIQQDLQIMSPGLGTQAPAAPSAAVGLGQAPQQSSMAPPQQSAPAPAASPQQLPASSQSRVVVDTATGQPVEMPGMGQPAPSPAAPVDERRSTIESAIAELGSGADPVQVRKRLAQQGISDDELQAAKKAQAKRLMQQSMAN